MAIVASDGTLLTLDSRNPQSLSNAIAMYCELPVAGTYTFTIADVVELPLGTCYYIEDLIAGATMVVEEGASWTITTSAPYAGNRFLIHTQNQAQIVAQDVECTNSATGSIEVTGASPEWVTLTQMSTGNTMTAAFNSAFHELTAGDYMVSIAIPFEGCSTGSIGIHIDEPHFLEPKILEQHAGSCNTESDGSVTAYWAEQTHYSYALLDWASHVVMQGISDTELLKLNQLAPQVYRLVMDNGCVIREVSFDLTDPNAVMAVILSENLTLDLEIGQTTQVSIYQNNINALETHWLINGQMAQSGDVFEYTFYQPGDYQLTLVAENGFCSAMDTIIIHVNPMAVVQESVIEDILVSQTTNHIQVYANALKKPIERIEIFDMNGRLVHDEKTTLSSGSYSIPKARWATGVYSVVLYRDGNPEIIKLFIAQQP